MSWAIDGHCRKSGGVRFSATAIRAAPESASVIFLDENWEGPGVRLKKKKPGSGPG
jgi:hypothetical protein